MKRLILIAAVILSCGLFAAESASASSATEVPALNEQRSSKGIGPYELSSEGLLSDRKDDARPSVKDDMESCDLPSVIIQSGIQDIPDSAAFAKLDTMLKGYTEAIAPESTDIKSAECDFLISSVKDSLTMQHIALWLYDHYKDSQLMGDEAVAIHIYDSWFKDGTIAMRSEFDKLDADIFTSFNRSTLLGLKAPVVDLKGPCGRKVRIPQDGSHSILFFFDTSCGKCQLEAKVLPGILEKIEFPTRFYAVFCGHDKAQWRKFRRTFKVRNRNVGIVHAWDPDMETDMLRLYGVISTPRLYFTDTDGEILGRRLEAESLAEIIQYINVYYGQKEK